MSLESGDRRNAHVATRGRATLAELMTWEYQEMVSEFPVLDERIQAVIAQRSAADDAGDSR